MGIGDIVQDFAEISDGQNMTIRPSGGTEVVIHNIYHGNNCDLKICESGTGTLTVGSGTGQGAWSKYAWHLNNSHFINLTNTSGTVAQYGYDGIITGT